MLKARLIKHICQRWIIPAWGPKLIGRKGRGAKHLVAQYSQEKELVRCGQLNLFKDNYKLHHFIFFSLVVVNGSQRDGETDVKLGNNNLCTLCEKLKIIMNGSRTTCHIGSKPSEFLRGFKHYFLVSEEKKEYWILLKCLKSHFTKVLIYHPVISILSTVSITIYFVFTLRFSSSKHKADTSGN